MTDWKISASSAEEEDCEGSGVELLYRTCAGVLLTYNREDGRALTTVLDIERVGGRHSTAN